MKRLLTIFLVFLALTAFPGKRYWIGGGTNSNWNSSPSTNWAATSGGTTRVASPQNTDTVYFDGVGPNANSASVISIGVSMKCLSVTSGYTNIITLNANTTVTGTYCSFHSNFTLAGTSDLSLYCTSFTTGNQTIPGRLLQVGGSNRTHIGNCYVTGQMVVGSQFQLNQNTNDTLFCNGGLYLASGTTTSTLPIYVRGGTLYSQGYSNYLNNDIFLDGNITIGTVTWPYFAMGAKTLTYLSGTITVTNSTLSSNSATFDTPGITWNNVMVNANNSTLTLNSTLDVSGSITFADGMNCTVTGTAGFTAANVIFSHTGSATINLQAGNTYQATNSFMAYKSRVGSNLLITSNHASDKAILTISDGASSNINCSFTRIDAGNGRTISTYNGTINDCINIIECHDCFSETIGG